MRRHYTKESIKALIRRQFGGGFSAGIFKRWVMIALGVGLSAHLVEGINYDSGWSLLFAVILMSVFNMVLKPLLILFTLPFIILSLGIGVWFINALLFLIVGRLIDGFSVESFSAALWGALIVSVVSLVIGMISGGSRGGGGGFGPPRNGPADNSRSHGPRPRVKEKKDEDEVIDI